MFELQIQWLSGSTNLFGYPPPPTPSLQKNKEKSLERSKLRLRPKSWLMQDLPEEAAAGQGPPPDPLPAGHGEDASD